MSAVPIRVSREGPGEVGFQKEALADHERQQAEQACTFDRTSQFTLLLRGDRGDAARNDLAALRDVTLQQTDVFVVDLRCIGTGERAGLPATEERTAARKLCNINHCLLLLITTAWRTATTRTLTTVATITTVAAITPATATAVVAITLLHHGGWFFIQFTDAEGHAAQDIFAEAHLTLHLGDSGMRRVDVHKRIVSFTIFLDAVGKGPQTPVFNLADSTTSTFDEALVLFDELFDLLCRNVLARQENVLIKRHENSLSSC